MCSSDLAELASANAEDVRRNWLDPGTRMRQASIGMDEASQRISESQAAVRRIESEVGVNTERQRQIIADTNLSVAGLEKLMVDMRLTEQQIRTGVAMVHQLGAAAGLSVQQMKNAAIQEQILDLSKTTAQNVQYKEKLRADFQHSFPGESATLLGFIIDAIVPSTVGHLVRGVMGN